MIRTIRTSLVRVAGIALGVILVTGACTPTAGPLGSPSTPAPTADASVVIPSSDVTPSTSEAPGTPAPSTEPSASDEAPSATVPPPTPTPAPTATPAPTGTIVVRAYFFLGTATNGDGLSVGLTPVLREVPKTQGVAAAALRALLEGPNAQEKGASPALRTDIPAGTKLLSVAIQGGVATVGLSSEFGSGSLKSSFGALAQVVYTVTQFQTVTSVEFKFDEGATFPVGIGGPLGRENFQDQLFAIFVDRPAWGASAGNPAAVSGLANVFEAQFRAQVLDASGKVLADRQVMASCGTGCWGDFSTSIPYTVTKAQWGTLRVFDPSAKDGTEQDVTEYPVWLVPAG